MCKILTIVIPSYNTERYIDECLPTIINISNKKKLEVLLINDGSKDGTLKKAREYMAQYPECISVIDKENAGHGSVINRGILEAQGKYFKVIDGDDWVKTENLEKLLADLENATEDMIVNDYIWHSEGNGKERKISFNIDSEKSMAFDDLKENKKEFSIHAITYKTELLKKNNLKFRENCFYEDSEYILYPIKYVNTFRYLAYPVYVYRIGSLTQSINPERAFKNRNMHYLITKDCIEFQLENMGSLSLKKKEYCGELVNRRIRSQYAIYFKGKLNKDIINELIKWDAELFELSKEFYKKSDTFPISFLRVNIEKNARFVWYLFSIYFKIRSFLR